MAAQPNSILSEQEYLAQEREAEVRHEYWFGTVVAMSGGSERHPLITLNVAGELRHALKRRGCRVYSSDMRLRVTPAGLYVYPDIMAVCVEPAFADARNDTLLNPTVIVEVLSPSTEKYDMGAKGWHYRTLESVRDYVTVAQDSPRIEICHRTSSREWVISITEGIDATLRIESLNVEIPLAEIYANVTFE
jgi:Uma2 family endonuclease